VLTDHRTAADDEMEGSRRDPAVAVALVELVAQQRALVRRLQHDRVAGDERAARGTARQRHREVERADHGPHAVGTQHVVVVPGGAEPAHRRPEPLVLLHLVAVPTDQLGGLLYVAEGFEAVLPDLIGHERGEVEDPLLHDVGDVAQDANALLPAHAVPLELEGLGRHDGVVHVLGRGLREAADDDVGVDRRGLLVLLVAPALLAVDDDGVVLAELGPGPLRGGVVGGLELLVVGRHRCVGDAELLGHREPPLLRWRSGPAHRCR
jgi:hypothetical protein